MKRIFLSAACGLLLSFSMAAPARQAWVEGAVRQPGAIALGAGARFADVLLVAGPTGEAYPLGAAVLRPSELAAQRRMKAGLQYDLDALAAAQLPGRVASQVAPLRTWLETLPVTGRVRIDMDPRRLELDRFSNRPAADGDRFVYPRRPHTIRVVGAVAGHCELVHVPLREAADYLRDCAPADSADRDWIYAIQPDGEVQRLGIGAWNRSEGHSLAPGALLYVPLDERAIGDVAPGFNVGMAAFLATQHLPAEAP
ncbi:capsule biosynthesis GfcC family protein [Pseudoxanthomonas suwonensis]|uniref:capsule biosynthesis GfcC family protein n=1 Tax=Pseudoxanthomonas suwonensis TaxID=314722 RepID=UPI0004915663|nr:capsule biosynthesis GfcC family protein [Pseudoxanthomonas suwonensis]